MSLTILAIGDSYLPVEAMRAPLAALQRSHAIRYATVDPDDRPPLAGLHEYQGSPAAIGGWLDEEDVLLVHAAPVTAELLDAHPSVKLVACARGGAVNIDLRAASERGVAVINTPGKNAVSVADLTMTFVNILFRGIWAANTWLRSEAASGVTHLDSTFVGGRWIAREPRGSVMGLIGIGAIGRLVAEQAHAAGMEVIAHDPYVVNAPEGVELVCLEELLRRSDAVSLHAKVTKDNYHLVGEREIQQMKPGAFLVNTARESLLDEAALHEALVSGRLRGAALDVCEPDGLWSKLVVMPQVVLSPHLGGATVQTQERGLAMLVADIERFARGESLRHQVA
ncbi:NAD(P)-dependent oxidoreductase [Mycetocola sp.]|uniref:NAD(P)-dependent oxidoreductase n=1 Tax=Mycetocola sp. TaxID=1871042 RepID=UPI0039892AAE